MLPVRESVVGTCDHSIGLMKHHPSSSVPLACLYRCKRLVMIAMACTALISCFYCSLSLLMTPTYQLFPHDQITIHYCDLNNTNLEPIQKNFEYHRLLPFNVRFIRHVVTNPYPDQVFLLSKMQCMSRNLTKYNIFLDSDAFIRTPCFIEKCFECADLCGFADVMISEKLPLLKRLWQKLKKQFEPMMNSGAFCYRDNHQFPEYDKSKWYTNAPTQLLFLNNWKSLDCYYSQSSNYDPEADVIHIFGGSKVYELPTPWTKWTLALPNAANSELIHDFIE